MLNVDADRLARQVSSYAQGSGAQSLWRAGCVRRLQQRSSVQTRTLRLLSSVRAVSSGLTRVLDSAVVVGGKYHRRVYRFALSVSVYVDMYYVLVRYRVQRSHLCSNASCWSFWTIFWPCSLGSKPYLNGSRRNNRRRRRSGARVRRTADSAATATAATFWVKAAYIRLGVSYPHDTDPQETLRAERHDYLSPVCCQTCSGDGAA